MASYAINISKLEEAIKIAGSMSDLAIKAKISYQSIIDWRKGRKYPSPESCRKIQKATGGLVKAEELLPDFPWHDM